MGKIALYTQLQLWCFAALIFVLPSNLFLTLNDAGAYVQGLRVDYLIPKLYLSDLFILAILITWGIERRSERHRVQTGQRQQHPQHVIVATASIFLLVLFIMAQLVVSARPLSTLWFLTKLFEYGIFLRWLLHHRTILQHRLIQHAWVAMLLFQSVLGLLQFALQRSVFPTYLWLGETRLQQYAGISKGSFNGVERILPYGTTAHSNILAGLLAIGGVYCLLSFLREKSPQKKWLSLVTSALCLGVLCLTQSFSGILAVILGVGMVWLIQQRKRLSLRHVSWLVAFCIIGSPIVLQLLSEHTIHTSITRRAWLNQAAVEVFLRSPITGIGVNTFTAHVEQGAPLTEVIRFVQPVHHVPLLVLSELGIVGVVLAGVTGWMWWLTGKLRRLSQNAAMIGLVLFPFLPLLVLDHYLWTNQVGQLLWMIGGSMLYSLVVTAHQKQRA